MLCDSAQERADTQLIFDRDGIGAQPRVILATITNAMLTQADVQLDGVAST